jgi:hypothetical protein
MPDDQNLMFPVLECDKLLFAALHTVWRDPGLLDTLGEMFLGENTKENSRALFRYLFVDCAMGSGPLDGVGFRPRTPIERLQYAKEAGLTV